MKRIFEGAASFLNSLALAGPATLGLTGSAPPRTGHISRGSGRYRYPRVETITREIAIGYDRYRETVRLTRLPDGHSIERVVDRELVPRGTQIYRRRKAA